MIKIIRLGIIKLFKYLILIAICFFVENILDSINALEMLDKDIKYISMNDVLVCFGIAIVMFGLFVFINKNVSTVFIWIKKHSNHINILLFVSGIALFYKCEYNYQWWISVMECLLAYILVDYETTQIYNYNLKECQWLDTNYVEKPVVGVSNLTSSQRNAYQQLKELIDNRKSTDSFNIGLIGAWGSGKTSITDTLIYEYEKKSNYFILKISSLTLKETKNVVNYVKNYFEDLFRKYEIGMGGRNVAFLTSLSRCFGNYGSISDMIANLDEHHFFDMEKEKELFTKQVSNLLEISGRKNILFFVDDTDRSEDEEQIIKLLIEFSSIEGIISIVSLDKSKDCIIRPQLSDDTNMYIYNQIDKYIHVRVRIEKDSHIEYDKSVSNQIITAFNNIHHKENCFISCDGENNKNSIFKISKDYQTTEILSSRFFSGNTHNILTELLLENLKCSPKHFGSYFEGLISEYIYNSKELFPYINKMLTVPTDNWPVELHMLNAQWTNSFAVEGFDWLMRLQSNSSTLFWTLCNIIEALQEICDEDEMIKDDVNEIQDVYDYWMINKFPGDGRTWKNRKEHPIVYSGLDQIRLIVFEQGEYDSLIKNLENKDFNAARMLLTEKAKGVANLFIISLILSDFMEYLRAVLNNYRTFKMQLRESELLNLNYLDYLIKEWQPRKELRDNFEKMKENNEVFKTLNIAFPSLGAFINNILFENYVLKFGSRFTNEELKNGRLFLYHGTNQVVIVITIKGKSIKESIVMDISGNIMTNIPEHIIHEIEKKNSVIWLN